MNLDAVDLRSADPGDMLSRIRELPSQCRDAWQQVQSLALPDDYRDVDAVAILGMGGSAIGGDLVRSLVAATCPLPVLVLRDYGLPAWAGKRTLVIGSSYSGNTEETLSAFGQAVERGCRLIAISTGGKLHEAAARAGAPFFQVRYQGAPRASLGWSLTPLVGIFQHLGFVPDQSAPVAEAIGVMEAWQREIDLPVAVTANPAKQLARRIQGKLPIIYGGGLLADVARRWKGQFNENAKSWSFFEVLPELDHNAVLGYEHPAWLAGQAVVLILGSPGDDPRLALRQQVTARLLERAGVDVAWVSPRGSSPLARILSIIHYGDYVSYYLALLNGADPSRMDAIEYLKDVLATSPSAASG
jgi:glucose/mannose-6-phosphate isomerase